MLAFENVSKSFDGSAGPVQALRDVSFSLASGDFVAVRGPSGCGKTTLLLIAGGLLRPSAGDVRIGGERPYDLTPDRRSTFRAEQIGFVFQQFHLVPYLNVLDNVLAPSLARPRPNAPARARELIEHFNLTHRMKHLPAELSTGERQRAALARAMLNEPKLLLADEPTGNLDEDNGRTVLDTLAEFAGNGGAVLLVTHDKASAAYAGRTLQLAEGRLLAETAQA